jgi:hypothetical protein
VYPAITRDNVGTLTPDDLMLGVMIFDALFPGEED